MAKPFVVSHHVSKAIILESLYTSNCVYQSKKCSFIAKQKSSLISEHHFNHYRDILSLEMCERHHRRIVHIIILFFRRIFLNFHVRASTRITQMEDTPSFQEELPSSSIVFSIVHNMLKFLGLIIFSSSFAKMKE